ncbi:hypothetical protein SLS62_010453 [Diatrype stigma]|uniref:Glycoside hydrolase 131 catalytic N-terminal domain-containing protein n=1 Tax=Diatrype stigma TaxID=117547 RepID=A0AAN9UBE4_9PEZI
MRATGATLLQQATALLLAAYAAGAGAALLWDGRFNDLESAADLNEWSWANQVGPYQYYIHGSGAVDKYVALSPDYKNPNDTVSRQGAKLTLDSTAYWNGQNMRRIELIPQTKAAINQGKTFYHLSMMRRDAAAPSANREHQICFFESHFAEMKYGWISGEQGAANPNLQFMVSQQSKWKTEWAPNVWHNIAFEIQFGSPGSVGFWHSEGGAPLEQIVAPVSTSPSSNGADWHLGVLELQRSGYPDANEDFYFSGVYIESGSITTAIGGPAA